MAGGTAPSVGHGCTAERRTPPPVEAGVVDDVQDGEEREWLEPHDDRPRQRDGP
ncbi:Hypothetical protein SCLAV_p1505 (plasmid) [Streptomyces clavuligerus]|uniref:Uncharacterized protein n=1 Tax=Streptomyces clavuligerus TaxID=1901 RepID=D5SM44_STRCL|nr:Hypothetical protein SCLAV_p1505 [Streptomyces clavuligerus]QPJ97159.1 hypothetical protein GE265_29050 [Streptomyces clavuligerus]